MLRTLELTTEVFSVHLGEVNGTKNSGMGLWRTPKGLSSGRFERIANLAGLDT
jgi:hypothetical protein